MNCAGGGQWPTAPAPTGTYRHRRGYCPRCGHAHALTHAGRIRRHTTTSDPLPEEIPP